MTNQRGFTLIELLVAMAMASIVMSAIFLSYKAQVQSKNSQEVSLEEQQSGRAGLERMASDIRMAGCNPTGNANSGFETIDATDIEVTMDISGGGGTLNESNGSIDMIDEHVRYFWDGDNIIRQRIPPAGGTPEAQQTIIPNVDALNFVYLDLNGNVTADADDIRSVEISMVIRGGEGDSPRGLMRTDVDTRRYRNLRGTPIFGPANDRFKRLQLNTIVHCRNMGRE
jgi:type IV pilus assembly protein PilW